MDGSGSDDNATFVGNGSFNITGGGHANNAVIDWTAIIAVRDVIWYSALALGIPGNILAAIVWLRRRGTGSSSVIYLAALAVVNLVYLLSRFICLHVIDSHVHVLDGWFWLGVNYLAGTAGILEPLLLLSFSVERLIAILRPLKVRLPCIMYRSSS